MRKIKQFRDRLIAWLRGRLHGWLSVPTEDEIVALLRKQYQWWGNLLTEREKKIDGKLAELEQIAGQVTLAVSDLITMMELEKRGYDPLAWKEESKDLERDKRDGAE